MKYLITLLLALTLCAPAFSQSQAQLDSLQQSIQGNDAKELTPLATAAHAITDSSFFPYLNAYNGSIVLKNKTNAFTYTMAFPVPLANSTLTLPSLSKRNASGTAQTPAAATRTYITGSNLAFTANQLAVGQVFRWRFNMTKTAAGTATSTFDVCLGTAGTTADTARVSFTKPAGTAVADEGWVTIECVIKTHSASGVVSGEFALIHNLAATGHAQIPCVVVNTQSSTFDTTLPTNIGVCITSGASDAITINQVSAEATGL
ncbi:MAG: hypothetical protein WCL08_00320 [Verrucomicrobiota bacterium]